MVRLRSSLLLIACLLASHALPAAGQSAASIVEEMKTRYFGQLETVDNYVIETNLYTSYHRKIDRDGQPTYETVSRIETGSEALNSFSSSPASTPMDPMYLDRLAQHATLDGTETINGTRSYRLNVANPSAVNQDAGEELQRMVFYVDADESVLTRIHMIVAPSGSEQGDSELTMDFTDYRTVQGLTLPYVMTMQMDLDLSEEHRQQIAQLKKKLEQMPEEQREQMKRLMGDRFDQIEDMMTGGTTTIEVQSVRVNEGIPDGVFSDSGN